MKGKVSVIVAVYNIEDYIERCIESILKQDYRNIEIIVVNDGSVDKSLNILNRLMQKDSRIIIINQSNKGLSEARKEGYKVATGEYLLFMDGDDWLEQNAIAQLYLLASKSDYDIVMYNAYKAWEKSRELMHSNKRDFNEDIDCLKALFSGDIMINIWSKFVRKGFLDELSHPLCSNISYGEDLASVSTWFINHPKVTYCSLPLYNYFQREDSITKTLNNKILEVNDAILYIKKELESNDSYLKYQKDFEYMAYIHLFETKFLYIDFKNPLHQQLYEQFKQYEINSENEYICARIKSYPLALKVRTSLYLKFYRVGKYYDVLRTKYKYTEGKDENRKFN